jgi:hypothetical protein
VFPEWVEVERDMELQGRVLVKMIIPNQDKVKRFLLLQLDAQVPEEEQKWIQVTLSKQKNQEMGMIFIMQPLQSVQMPIIKYQEFLCSLLTALPNQYLMLHRHWRINNLRIQKAKNYFWNVFNPFGTETNVFLLDDLKNSDEAHLSAVTAAIQYSETLLQNQDDFPPDFEPSDEEDEYSRLQNPTKTPIV